MNKAGPNMKRPRETPSGDIDSAKQSMNYNEQ
jgi:hypothetical protein